MGIIARTTELEPLSMSDAGIEHFKGLGHRIDYTKSLKIEIDKSRPEEGMRQDFKFFRGSSDFKYKKIEIPCS